MKNISPENDLVRIVSSDKKKKEEDTNEHWDGEIKWKWNIIYFVGSMLVYSARTSMSVCVAAVSIEMGWSKQISGMALSAFFCGYVLTNVVGGHFADHYGGEKMIIYSATVWGTVTLMLPYFARSKNFLYSGTVAVLTARFLTGCGQGFYFPSFSSISTKHIQISDRGMFTGFSYSGCALGTIAMGFFGSILIEHVGWQYVFMVVGILTLLWVYVMRHFYYKTTAVTVSSKRLKQNIDSVIEKKSVPWKRLTKEPAIWALMFCYFCNGYAFYNLLSWAPVYFHDAFPESKGWVFNVVPWLASFILQNLTGYYSNNLISSGLSVIFVRKLYSAVLFLGTTVFSLLLISVETFQQALVVMALTVGVGTFNTCSITMNPQDLLPEHAGALFGLGNMLSALGGTIGVYLTGYILEKAGHWSSIFFINAVVSLFAFIAFQLFGSAEPIRY